MRSYLYTRDGAWDGIPTRQDVADEAKKVRSKPIKGKAENVHVLLNFRKLDFAGRMVRTFSSVCHLNSTPIFVCV